MSLCVSLSLYTIVLGCLCLSGSTNIIANPAHRNGSAACLRHLASEDPDRSLNRYRAACIFKSCSRMLSSECTSGRPRARKATLGWAQ